MDPNLEGALAEHWMQWTTERQQLIDSGGGFGGKHGLTYKQAAIGAEGCPALFSSVIKRLSELLEIERRPDD